MEPTNPLNEMTDQELECLRRLLRKQFAIPDLWDFMVTAVPPFHDELTVNFSPFVRMAEFTILHPRAILHGTTS
jgi:hypothetical protein